MSHLGLRAAAMLRKIAQTYFEPRAINASFRITLRHCGPKVMRIFVGQSKTAPVGSNLDLSRITSLRPSGKHEPSSKGKLLLKCGSKSVQTLVLNQVRKRGYPDSDCVGLP